MGHKYTDGATIAFMVVLIIIIVVLIIVMSIPAGRGRRAGCDYISGSNGEVRVKPSPAAAFFREGDGVLAWSGLGQKFDSHETKMYPGSSMGLTNPITAIADSQGNDFPVVITNSMEDFNIAKVGMKPNRGQIFVSIIDQHPGMCTANQPAPGPMNVGEYYISNEELVSGAAPAHHAAPHHAAPHHAAPHHAAPHHAAPHHAAPHHMAPHHMAPHHMAHRPEARRVKSDKKERHARRAKQARRPRHKMHPQNKKYHPIDHQGNGDVQILNVEQDIDNMVQQLEDGIVMVVSPNCGACTSLMMNLANENENDDRVADLLDSGKVLVVNAANFKGAKVNAVPTTFYYKNGKIVDSKMGARPIKELLKL
jgi:hypothetical protein